MNKKKYEKIIVTGSIAYDEIMVFPGEFKNYFHKDKLHQINVSFAVDRLEKELGGTGANIAYNANLLMPKKVHLLSSVGRDGNQFYSWMEDVGLHTSGVIKDSDLYTASGKVITDIKDNQIWGYYYGALSKAAEINLGNYAGEKDLLIISATQKDAFLNFQKQAISQKIDYIYDPGMTLTWIAKRELREGILNSCYLIGNDYEISQICLFAGFTKEELIKKNIAIITTKGQEGVDYIDRNNNLSLQAYKLKKIVDPTGAGDAWRGGFAAGILMNLDLVDCLAQANALSSFAVEKYGTVNHKPTLNLIKDRAEKIVSRL